MSFTSDDNENRVVNGTLKSGDGLETFIEFTSSYNDDFETVGVDINYPITICHGNVLRGYQGYQGVSGLGFQGFSGAIGADGNQGYQGASGLGFQGFSGAIGADGNQGYQGNSGVEGRTGDKGGQGS